MTSTSKKENFKVRDLALAILACAPLALNSCAAIADSSASLASVASISASSAGMMAAVESAFHDDVRMAAAASVESGARSEDLLRNIGQVATDHGITDWEADSGTFYAVGEGLREAGMKEDQILAMAPKLTGGNREAAASFLKGFRAA